MSKTYRIFTFKEDYRRTVQELDDNEFHHLRTTVIEVRNFYVMLHNLGKYFKGFGEKTATECSGQDSEDINTNSRGSSGTQIVPVGSSTHAMEVDEHLAKEATQEIQCDRTNLSDSIKIEELPRDVSRENVILITPCQNESKSDKKSQQDDELPANGNDAEISDEIDEPPLESENLMVTLNPNDLLAMCDSDDESTGDGEDDENGGAERTALKEKTTSGIKRKKLTPTHHMVVKSGSVMTIAATQLSPRLNQPPQRVVTPARVTKPAVIVNSKQLPSLPQNYYFMQASVNIPSITSPILRTYSR